MSIGKSHTSYSQTPIVNVEPISQQIDNSTNSSSHFTTSLPTVASPANFETPPTDTPDTEKKPIKPLENNKTFDFKNNVVYQLLYSYFINEKYYFFGIIVIVFAVNIIQTSFISSITSSIIDSIEHKQYSEVYAQYKYFIGVSVVYFILYMISEYLQIIVLTKLTPWMRNEFFKYVIRSNNEELSQKNVVKYSSPINRVSFAATHIVTNILNNVISNGAFLLIISGYFFYKNIELGIMFFLSNIILTVYVVLNWKDLMYYKNIYESHLNNNELDAIDMFNNFDKVIYRGQSENEINEYTIRSEKCIQTSADFQYATANHQMVMTIFVYTIIFIALWYLIRLKIGAKINTQVFIAFFTILLLYREKLTGVLQMIPQFMEFQGRINFVLDSFGDIKGAYSDIKLKTFKNIPLEFNTIRFENVSYKYKSSEKYLFEKLNFDIQTNGKIIGLTGKSGRGKSTVMKLLLKLHDYSEGNIYIDGQNIRDINPAYIRENITYVNQSGKLFNKTVFENMVYGCKDKTQCDTFLKIIMKYPSINDLYQNIDIYKKEAGMLGENLSGGQRQIVNILSGLVNPSKILILDEPTNALDLNLKTELLGIIDSFRKYKKCIIIITHDRDVYPLFDERIQI